MPKTEFIPTIKDFWLVEIRQLASVFRRVKIGIMGLWTE